ncbi:MAG TPA: cbb3-type cytochrome c oxidase subunit I, partial [Amycolatopsis sp.]|nr:cbb3-type cytochrome c oxidase subunit I [Amycolatopsis sp.]
MTQTRQSEIRLVPVSPRRTPARLGTSVLRLISTTDHKDIGVLYVTTSFGFFLVAGALAMLMRGELAQPGMQLVTTEQYNQLVSVHGTLMLLLYATP